MHTGSFLKMRMSARITKLINLSFRLVKNTAAGWFKGKTSGIDLRPAFRRGVIPYLERTMEREFSGGRFVPLSPRYKKWKKRHYPGRPILTLTGAMRASLTDSWAGGAVRDMTKTRLRFGSSLMVGKWNLLDLHVKGTDKMPARFTRPFGPVVRRKAREEITLYLHDFLRGRV